MAKRDYYDILGIHRTATADEIKKAYRKLAMKHHPDRAEGDKKAAEGRFNEIQEAYDVLSEPPKRRNYDQFGHAGVGAGTAAGAGPGRAGDDPFEAFRRAQGGGRRQWRASPNVSVEDFDFGAGGGDVASVFEQFFGRGAQPRGGRGRTGPAQGGPPPRGADVEHPVTLTFEQAARGSTLPLQINREGHLETIEVKIPPGVKDGSRIRIRGRGQQSHGEPGDLFIVTRVTPHPYFKREGLDVFVDVPISVYEAMLGTKVDVPTLEGPLTVTIPPGTSSGAKLRLKGRGVERADEKGDQYVVMKVVVPKDLDDADQETLKKLAEKHPLHPRKDVGW